MDWLRIMLSLVGFTAVAITAGAILHRTKNLAWGAFISIIAPVLMLVCLVWGASNQHVQKPQYRTAVVTSLWETQQIRQWCDSTEVVYSYNLRVDRVWGALFNEADYRALRVGDRLVVRTGRDSVYFHGRPLEFRWTVFYPDIVHAPVKAE